MKSIQLHDHTFQPYLAATEIQTRVKAMAQELSRDLGNQRPVFLVMLKGAFVFAADLVRHFAGACEISFVRTQSYSGLESTKSVRIILGPEPEEVKDRHLIIVEDIVDSGHTMARFLPLVRAMKPASITLASLLFKPDMLEEDVRIDHIGFTIPQKFVVGYGLDYDGLGRHLPDIYQLAE